MSIEILDLCKTKCKPDCSAKQYFTEINKTYDDLVSALHSGTIRRDMTNVIFQHNSIPDVIVRHSLEMTFMSFVCNFGGLLGMWLGFSVLSISKDIFKTIHLLCRFDRSKINFINNFHFHLNNINIPYNRNNLPRVDVE